MMITATKVKAIHIAYPSPAPPLTHTQAIAQGDTGHTEGGCPGHGDGEEQVRLRPMVTWVIS